MKAGIGVDNDIGCLVAPRSEKVNDSIIKQGAEGVRFQNQGLHSPNLIQLQVI